MIMFIGIALTTDIILFGNESSGHMVFSIIVDLSKENQSQPTLQG